MAKCGSLPGRVYPIKSHEKPPFSYGFPMDFLKNAIHLPMPDQQASRFQSMPVHGHIGVPIGLAHTHM